MPPQPLDLIRPRPAPKGTSIPLSSQFQLIDGVAQESGPYLGYYGAGTGHLYVAVEVNQPRAQDLARQTVEALGREFLGDPRAAVTTRLLNALRRLQQRLLEANRQRLPGERGGLGVTVAYLRGAELYLAQGGPALGYLVSPGGVRRIAAGHAAAAWDGGWLGLDETLEITPAHLTHVRLRGAERLILVAGRALREGEPEALTQWLRLDPPDTLRALYLALRSQGNAAVLQVLLPLLEGAEGVLPPKVNPLKTRAVPGLAAARPRLGSWLAAVTGRSRPPRRPSPAAPAPAPPLAPLPRPAPAAPARLWLLGRLPPPLLAVTALILATLVASGALVLADRLRQQREEVFQAALGRAQAAAAQARTAPDRATARRQLQEAERAVVEALGLVGHHPGAWELQARIRTELASVNGIVPLGESTLLLDLGRLERGAAVSQVVVAEERAYLLDQGMGQVYQYPLAAAPAQGGGPGPAIILRREQRLNGLTLGTPVSLLWMPRGGLRNRAELLVLDQGRALVAYHPAQGARAIPLRGTSQWGGFLKAVGYNGNLYILDPVAQQVWRYFPTDSGYDSEMRGMLQNARLDAPLDLAVDGTIYLLEASGRLRRFLSGREEPFPQEGIDQPLSRPLALFASAAAQYLYVAEGSPRRIVVFTKEGAFQRQLVGELLRDLQAFHVDEVGRKIYLIAHQGLYVTTLPEG